MSEWLDRVKSHPINQRVENLIVSLDGISISPGDPPEIVSDIERLKNVAMFIQQCIDDLDPFLVPLQVLTQIDNSIQGIVTEINNYHSNRNRGHLVNANNHADKTLSHISQLVFPKNIVGLEFAKESLDSYRDASVNYLNEIENKRKEIENNVNILRARIDETINDISSQKTRLDNAIAEYQQQFSKMENARNEQFNEALNNQKQHFDENIKLFQEKIQVIIDYCKQSTDTQILENKNEFQDISGKLRIDALNVINLLEDYKDKAQNLLHVIGSTGMAGEYQKVADRAGKKTFG